MYVYFIHKYYIIVGVLKNCKTYLIFIEEFLFHRYPATHLL